MALRFRIYLSFFLFMACYGSLKAQNYQAIHGSSYAGSLGAANNPASIVDMPFAWDFTPLAIQLKHSTNAFIINNSSFLSPGKNAEVKGVLGDLKRTLMANQDIRLFNGRVRLNPTSAIAFGISVRNYISAKTSAVNWRDTFSGLRNFLDVNANNLPLSAKARVASWAEIYGTYARTFVNRENAIINGGVTLKINRGLGAGYVTASDLSVITGTVNGNPGYFLNGGSVEYGYSSNLDNLDSGLTFKDIRKRLLKKSFSTIAANIGMEFIIPAVIEGDENNTYSYDWKIGISLLDLGYNNYQYSSNSRRAVLTKANISDSIIQSAFENLNSIDDLPDSLQSIAGNITALSGNFHVFQPTRIVINADKHLMGNFFINGELTIPLNGALNAIKQANLFFRDMNLVAITPRYEKRTVGFYLPMTYNTNKQFWIGGAFKVGPLLLGIHNWGNLFSKNKLQNGGGYLALTFKPGKKHQQSSSKERIATKKLSAKERKQLDCPQL